MSKAKKVESVKKPAKAKIKNKYIDEIIVEGIIKRKTKISIPDMYQISITSQDFEMEIELHVELLDLIAKKFDYVFEEKKNLYIKISKNEIKQDLAIFLGKCSLYDVGSNYFMGSIGGLNIKLTNLTKNIQLFPPTAEVMVGFFKTMEELQKS